MHLLLLAPPVRHVVLLQLSVEAKVVSNFLGVLPEVGALTHHYLVQSVFVWGGGSKEEVLQEGRLFEGRVVDEFLAAAQGYSVQQTATHDPFLQPLARLGKVSKDVGFVGHHDMDQLVTQEVYVAEDALIEADPRQTNRVPDLRSQQGRLALNEGVQQTNVGSRQLNPLLLVHANHLLHRHQDVDLQTLDLLLPHQPPQTTPQRLRQRHHRNCLESNGD